MRRRWLGRLVLVVGGAVAGLLAVEAVARLVRPAGHADLLFDSPDASPDGLYVIDPELVLVPKPGFSGVIRSQGYRVPLDFDDEGVRTGGTNHRPETWLAVGDSFTLSVQVPSEETFVSRLGDLSEINVLNLGVDGYSTWQASRRAARHARTRSTSGVLLTFFLGNDFQDNERFPHMLATVQGRTAGEPIPRPSVSLAERLLLRFSSAYAHLRVWNRARRLRLGGDPSRKRWRDELSIFSEEGGGTLERLVPATRRALVEARDEARRRGEALMVALAPPAFVVHRERLKDTFEVVGLDPERARPRAPGERLRRELTSLGIASCDLTDALVSAAEQGAQLYFTYDGHWTADGHRVVSERLAACLNGESI